MKVKIKKSCRYAHPTGPHMPQLEFIAGQIVDVIEKLALSIIGNKHGLEVPSDTPEKKVVEPESKDENVPVESKDDLSDDGEESGAEDAPRKRGRPRKNP